LASGNDNGAIVLWNLDSNRWRERACEVAGRNLTWAEWSQFLGDSKPYHDTCPDVDLYFSQKVIQADTYAQTGDKEQAGQAFAEVVEAAQDTESAEFNNVVCRYGSLDGFAEIVLPACEEAVDLASEDEDETQVGRYQDSRGVALALNDQPDQAIEDFGAFIDWATEKKRPQREVALRQKWIDDLKANRNPFDPDTLVNLRPN